MLNKIYGSLLGVAIGDAMGMPVEMMSRQEILDMTDSKGVTGYLPSCGRINDTKNLPAGSTTDDWGLTKAVLESLIRKRTFCRLDCALSQIEALKTITGTGRATREGLAQVKLYLDSNGKQGRSPLDRYYPPEGTCSGNGVAMKISPLVLMHRFYTEDILFELANKLGGITHDYEAILAAYGFALTLSIFRYKDFVIKILTMKDIFHI